MRPRQTGPISANRPTVAQPAAHPLKPGQHYWMPAVAPQGPLVVVVNLALQMLCVYRNGLCIGYSSISSGRRGYATAQGIYTVLEKRRLHRSNLYDNAPMPYMVRLTWGGLALHGGNLPGYPASHGCVRLPMPFAALLFENIHHNDCVAILHTSMESAASPFSLLAPLTPWGRPSLTSSMLEPSAPWMASHPPHPTRHEAPLQLLATLAERRLYGVQNGQVTAVNSIVANSPFERAHPKTAFYAWNTSDTTSGFWTDTQQTPLAIERLLQRSLRHDGVAFMEKMRQRLSAGSSLLVSHLPAVNDTHASAWGLL